VITNAVCFLISILLLLKSNCTQSIFLTWSLDVTCLLISDFCVHMLTTYQPQYRIQHSMKPTIYMLNIIEKL
jgi:hypothetical protein